MDGDVVIPTTCRAEPCLLSPPAPMLGSSSESYPWIHGYFLNGSYLVWTNRLKRSLHIYVIMWRMCGLNVSTAKKHKTVKINTEKGKEIVYVKYMGINNVCACI